MSNIALTVVVPPPASAPLPVPASSEPKETAAVAPVAREPGAPLPALAPPLLTAASVPPPASAPLPVPASSEPKETGVPCESVWPTDTPSFHAAKTLSCRSTDMFAMLHDFVPLYRSRQGEVRGVRAASVACEFIRCLIRPLAPKGFPLHNV
jgi:hypothetical protein